jgi:hypothetical protein
VLPPNLQSGTRDAVGGGGVHFIRWAS